MRAFSVLALVLAFAVAATATWTYGLKSNPTIQWVSLQGDPLAIEVTSQLSDDNDTPLLNQTVPFDFSFYGSAAPSDQLVLNSNGYISFNGSTTGSYQVSCPLPVNDTLLANRAFAFYWTDWCFDCLSGPREGHAYYRFFEPGSCPYLAKQSEGCLLVDYQNATDNDGLVIGYVNAFLFTSGVMLSQVKVVPTGVWGEPSEDDGALFGIQDKSQNVGQMFPNSSCAWFTGGFLNESFVGPNGGQFSFAFYPPCGVIGNLTGPVRADGLGCGCGGGYYQDNISCFPCASSQISDGVTCSDCTGGLVPNFNRSTCVQQSSGAINGPQLPLLLLLSLICMLFLFV